MRLTISVLLLLSGAVWAADKDTCFSCHEVMEGMSQVFVDDVHYKNKLSCADCHGGDQKEDDQNLSMAAARGFKVRVVRKEVPEYCGKCHSDSAFMGKHGQKRADQVARYRTSVHSQALMAGHRAAECIDCHGIHTIRAASDPESLASPAKVSATCATCHKEVAAAFGKSPHGSLFTSKDMAGCTACHDSHATQRATSAMLTGPKAVCAKCHKAGSEEAKTAAAMAKVLAGLEAAAKTGGAAAKQNLEKARIAVHTADLASLK